MSTVKLLYGSSAQALTITLASLASSTTAARASTFIDNSSNLFEDILFGLTIKTQAGGSTTGFVNILATGSTDGGTTYGENATGTDGGITLTSPPNVRLIGSINTPSASALTYKMTPVSLAKAFDGTLPQQIVIIVNNQSGAALDATEGNHIKTYQGVQRQVV